MKSFIPTGPACFYVNDPAVAVDRERFAQGIEDLSKWLDWADAVVVGLGLGMSAAAAGPCASPASSCDSAPADDDLARVLAPFKQKHGITSLVDGYNHLYSSNEEEWAYLASYITYTLDRPVAQAYFDLAALLGDKPYTVLTTNTDGQASKAFGEERVFEFQGSLSYLQCGQPCGEELYDAGDPMRRIAGALGPDLSCPEDLLPRCPHCHRLMRPWVRDSIFVEGRRWQVSRERYEAFLRRHLLGAADVASDAGSVGCAEDAGDAADADKAGRQEENVLFLELGVGDMAPGIIKMPFWQMTRNNPNARLCVVNASKDQAPEYLDNRAMAVAGNVGEALSLLRGMRF